MPAIARPVGVVRSRASVNGKRHRVDPFAYLKDILYRLPAHPADRLGELLPDAWIAANPDARRRVAS
jgi:transposase